MIDQQLAKFKILSKGSDLIVLEVGASIYMVFTYV